MPSSNPSWFSVDRDGLRELHGNFPPERMILELIQNAWDESSTSCEVVMHHEVKHAGRIATVVIVRDDNPTGFRNLADAYTLFGSTPKRRDPTKRGRFNYGEKIVLSRAISARISSTTGEIIFDNKGRHNRRRRRESGSEIEVFFPRWTKAEFAQAAAFLRRLLPPPQITLTINGEAIHSRTPERVHSATLATEILSVADGVSSMTRTARATTMEFYPKFDASAFLYEMGIPVCEVAGDRDINVLQKVPLSQDRTAVTPAYLQDIYAETVKAFGDQLNVDALGIEVVQAALADERVDPNTARTVFGCIYGEDAAIQSHDPDSDQEAARKGFTIVPSRTWGKDVNDKLRAAGVQTTHDLFGRDGAKEGARIIPPSDYTPAQQVFVAYVRMLASELYDDQAFSVELGRWDKSNVIAFNQDKSYLVFHADRLAVDYPVSRCTSTILHELAHCKGDGHNGVYDFEFERLVNEHTVLLAQRPQRYREFEPSCFK